MSTGMPAGIWLTKFGCIVRDYFGHVPYHVGSSLKSKDWRDVDVRLILPDAEFEERFGKLHSAEINPKLAAITLAFSALGKAIPACRSTSRSSRRRGRTSNTRGPGRR